MKVAVSFLKSNYNFDESISKIEKSTADYIHVDVMDGLFVNNKTLQDKNELEILKKVKKPKDIHLMTLHVKSYIDLFSTINPEIITFSYEATTNPLELINYIKRKEIKAGIAINPLTDIKEIEGFLSQLDLVLLMGVIPGYGNQKFISETITKFKELDKLRRNNKYKFKISVDGGINNETIKLFSKRLDMAVAGSFVCSSNNFDKQINELKNPSF